MNEGPLSSGASLLSAPAQPCRVHRAGFLAAVTSQPMFLFRQASFAFSGAFRLGVCAEFYGQFLLPVVRASFPLLFFYFMHRDSLGSILLSWPAQLVFLASSRLLFWRFALTFSFSCRSWSGFVHPRTDLLMKHQF